MDLLCLGLTQSAIAAVIGVKVGTMRGLMGDTYQKLRAVNAAHAAATWTRYKTCGR